jgi:hypothetical protein
MLTFDLGGELPQGLFRILPTVIFVYAQKDIAMADDVDELEDGLAPCASDQVAVYNVRRDEYALVLRIGSGLVVGAGRVRRVKYGSYDEQEAYDGQQDVETPP